MKRMFLALVCTLSFFAFSAEATTITTTIPEFNGIYHAGGDPYPLPAVPVGTFSYTIPPGERVVSATLSGTFGNSSIPNSAAVQVLADGLQVAECLYQDTCWTSPSPTAWDFIIPSSDLTKLQDGSLVLTAVQTSEYTIRLGEAVLTITTRAAAVPTMNEWGMIILAILMAASALWVMHRRKRAW